jgi:hypothetical protein
MLYMSPEAIGWLMSAGIVAFLIGLTVLAWRQWR